MRTKLNVFGHIKLISLISIVLRITNFKKFMAKLGLIGIISLFFSVCNREDKNVAQVAALYFQVL
jgi:hypothetical protein